jgi:ADP-dependent NAD(P)H-hydrate dehydratase
MTDELPFLPRRDPNGHKGTFGTVAIIGGRAGPDVQMIGAPALVALGALRAGAGLAKLIVPEPIAATAIGICPSATALPAPVGPDGTMRPQPLIELTDRALGARTEGTTNDRCECVVIGPGLGTGDAPHAAALRGIQQDTTPIVLDADGLNALAEIPEFWRDFRAPAVLTPHPGEFRRLAAALMLNADAVTVAARPAAAELLAQRLGCVVVLKGAGTIVTDGHRTWTCTRGHACLATAGTGDVLAGVIAGLIAQFVRLGPEAQLRAAAHNAALARGLIPSSAPNSTSTQPPTLDLFNAARLAVQAHALAGERWATTRAATAGLLAAELANEIPPILESLRQKS